MSFDRCRKSEFISTGVDRVTRLVYCHIFELQVANGCQLKEERSFNGSVLREIHPSVSGDLELSASNRDVR